MEDKERQRLNEKIMERWRKSKISTLEINYKENIIILKFSIYDAGELEIKIIEEILKKYSEKISYTKATIHDIRQYPYLGLRCKEDVLEETFQKAERIFKEIEKMISIIKNKIPAIIAEQSSGEAK